MPEVKHAENMIHGSAWEYLFLRQLTALALVSEPALRRELNGEHLGESTELALSQIVFFYLWAFAF